MFKGKVLDCSSFTSQKGNVLTKLCVQFSNGKVAYVLESGSLSFASGSECEFEIVPSGAYSSASVRLLRK